MLLEFSVALRSSKAFGFRLVAPKANSSLGLQREEAFFSASAAVTGLWLLVISLPHTQPEGLSAAQATSLRVTVEVHYTSQREIAVASTDESA